VIILKIYSGIASGEQNFIEREREREREKWINRINKKFSL